MEFAPFGDVRALLVASWGMGMYEEIGELDESYVYSLMGDL
jgi:hypothetical protein